MSNLGVEDHRASERTVGVTECIAGWSFTLHLNTQL